MVQRKKMLMGMVHLLPLPGSPLSEKSVSQITDIAVEEARGLETAGFDGVVIENMHDRPYLKGTIASETVAAMMDIAKAVRMETRFQLGIQILSAANIQALEVARAVQADFIRVESFVYGHIADEGWIDACAGPLLRYRKERDATKIKIFADIKKKHASHSVTSDLSIADTARAAEFNLADGVIVTGAFTGQPPSRKDISSTTCAINIPVWIGSGVTPRNLKQFGRNIEGVIVGSALKKDGIWSNPMDSTAVNKMSEVFQKWKATI